MKMKKALLSIALLSAPTLWALGPDSLAGKTISIDMTHALVARTDMHRPAEGPWYAWHDVTNFVLYFPAADSFSAQVHYSAGLSNELTVSYTPDTAADKGSIKVECRDFTAHISLSYTGNTCGTALIEWHEAGDTRHIRRTSFTLQDNPDSGAYVQMPEEVIVRNTELWDDGLRDILREIEQTRYRTYCDKLYQKRLSTLLPQIMKLRDASYTGKEYKGNTALHYACGLSHVKLVQWLVNHGADLQAYTRKGASIDACVGGPNAREIKQILREARAWRDRPYEGPAVDKATAQAAADALDAQFRSQTPPVVDGEVPGDDAEARKNAGLVYRYVKQHRRLPRINPEMAPGRLLKLVRRARMSEEMYADRLLGELLQQRRRQHFARQKDGLALALLPHMILYRDKQALGFDAASAVYRAAREGNTELEQWLINHGASPVRRNEKGEVNTDIPMQTP